MYNRNQNSMNPGTRHENPYDDEYNYDDNQSDDNASSASSKNAKPSLSTNNTRVTIFDRGAKDSKITKNRKPVLEKALFEMMYRELISDADIKPRFKKNVYANGYYRAIAIGVSSAAFLKDRVEKMPPPWNGAQLEVVYRGMQKNNVEVEPKQNNTEPRRPRIEARQTNAEPRWTNVEPRRTNFEPNRTNIEPQRVNIEDKRFNVEAYVPGQLPSTNYLFDVIRQFESSISTSKWQQYKVRPHGQGHVFTFNIDGHSYHQLDKLNGFVPYFSSGIEFRILKDEYL